MGCLMYRVCALVLLISHQVSEAVAQEACFENPELNDFFATDDPTTCCQNDVCAIPCPESVSKPTKGFGIGIVVAIVISFLIGFATLFLVQGEAENFFVAGRSLPLWIVAITLGAQSIDSNAILGNADLSYKYHFYDGAVLPIGLGLSLILNAAFLARHINNEVGVLTLPDILAKRYGKLTEVIITCACIVSFIMLLAGNLVGMGNILSYVWDVSLDGGIWTASAIIWAYTVSGGLFSVAYTDVAQGIMGWSGCIVCVFYLIASEDIRAPPPSIGLPGYIYPDGIGDGGICDMYEGISCVNDNTLCCYNEELWCPSADNCRADNGAYPTGDQPIFNNQMGDFLALAPFPNNIFYNWATIFILGFGNLAALDFQARCIAAKTPKIATLGCLIGGLFTFFVGVPFAYMGALSRVYYGPDSVHAVFVADTCNPLLGLPTCAAWQPDPMAFLKLLTHQAPSFLGGWCLFGIVAASMSTADGAILAMGTCFAHNILRQLDPWFPGLINDKNLLTMARLSTIPFTLASALIASFYTSDKSTGATGYLLIVAFDVVLATAVVPLIGCFYTKTPRPNAAFLSCISGAAMRITLEFALPKDGFLLLPYDVPEFQDYGPAASTLLPTWIDAPKNETWNPDEQVCDQPQLKDFTGVDSLAAFLTAILVFCLVQTLEHHLDRPLFTLPSLQPYEKDLGGNRPKEDDVSTTRHVLDMSAGTARPVKDGEKPISIEDNSSDDKAEVIDEAEVTEEAGVIEEA